MKNEFKLEQRQTKTVAFHVTECKEENRNGVSVGIIEGFASTWELDEGDDIIRRGAFEQTIREHIDRDNRQVRMLRQHTKTLIGGFPIQSVKETPEGLMVRGEVNLTEGSEGLFAYSLAKQGVLVDMSIGFSFYSIDDFSREEIDGKQVRVINRLKLWEISLVNDPMNQGAQVTAVKSAETCETVRDVEEYLKSLGVSCKESKRLISVIKGMEVRDEQPDDLESEVDSGRDDDESLSLISEKLDAMNNDFALRVIKQNLNKI